MVAGKSLSPDNPKSDTASQTIEKLIAIGTPHGAMSAAFQKLAQPVFTVGMPADYTTSNRLCYRPPEYRHRTPETAPTHH